MSKPVLFERVVLARDLEAHGMKRGDVATFVDTVPHPAGGPEGLVLEVTHALGDALQVVVVTADDIWHSKPMKCSPCDRLSRRRDSSWAI